MARRSQTLHVHFTNQQVNFLTTYKEHVKRGLKVQGWQSSMRFLLDVTRS